ncbi:Winged helix-turn-helix DNA-binding domain [Lasallia pustulata]|uniref:Winged helix-turn-helix DNA-binding domain n=1 Tax=Lasallia pustulata TaxID=136370 RepID=A0A1W5D620_9LECA|nr:Winged helix-turn-helix DNA-binding domain [Lasallia pustulata]
MATEPTDLRTLAESCLQSAQATVQLAKATESTARTLAESYLQSAKATESTNGTLAESSLQSAKATESTNGTLAEPSVQSAKATESTNGTPAETSVQSAKATESTSGTPAEPSVQSAKATESTNGTLAESSVQSAKATESTDLGTLAESCVQSAKAIKAFIDSSGHGRLAFDPLALSTFPKSDEVTERARTNLRNAARTMYDLTTGPEEYLMESTLTSLQYINSMRYICHFKIPDSVPDTGEIDYHSLAKSCAVDPAQLKQFLRFVMTNRIFWEPTPNHVAHTIGSRMLKEGNPMRPYVQWLTEDCAPMIAHQIDAIEKWGHGSQEPNQTAVNYAYGGDGPYYNFIQADPVRERRFGATIQQVSQQPASSLEHIQSAFDWNSLGDATVIDVGGHIGYCAVAIAQAAPKLHLIVQDRPEVVAMAQDPKISAVPADLRDRVSFEVHDFYQPQKTPADVYFYRKTLLNHTDKYAIKVIHALSPALKPGNRLLIMDYVQSDGPVKPTVTERYYRAIDLQMLLYYNCRYRTLDEWKELVIASDSRFEFETACTPPGSGMAIISFIIR